MFTKKIAVFHYAHISNPNDLPKITAAIHPNLKNGQDDSHAYLSVFILPYAIKGIKPNESKIDEFCVFFVE